MATVYAAIFAAKTVYNQETRLEVQARVKWHCDCLCGWKFLAAEKPSVVRAKTARYATIGMVLDSGLLRSFETPVKTVADGGRFAHFCVEL
jgi:hypothetical protein